MLEDLGFIRTAPEGARQLGYALPIHPELAVDVLRRRGKIDTNWLNAYSQRLIEMGGGKTPAETAAKA